MAPPAALPVACGGHYTLGLMKLAHTIILSLCLCALALRAGGSHAHVALDHEDVHMHEDMHLDDRQDHVHLVAPDHSHELHSNHHAHEHDAGQQHIEVDLDGQVLSKKLSSDAGTEGLVLAVALVLFLLAPRQLVPSFTPLIAPRLQRLIHLRPPLRGPPLHA